MLFPESLPRRVRALAPGEHLFRQGDAPRSAFRLVTGALRLERRTFDGRLVVIHRARAGEVFAEASLFAPAYHCDAVATEASSVEAVARDAVLAAMRADPAVAEALLARMAGQLQDARRRLELRDVRGARDRVLLQLDLLADRDGIVLVPGALQDLAAEIGLTREAYYRTLAALARAGLLTREPGRIRLRPRA